MKATQVNKCQHSGFSLVELMVGMLLGLILIAGAGSIYLASKRSYVEVEQVAALAENARFAEQMLGDSLRHMGFIGENTPGNITRDPNLGAVVGDCSGFAAAYDLRYLGWTASTNASGKALGCITDAVPNTDVLVIKRSLPQPYSDTPRDDPSDTTVPDGVIDTPTLPPAEFTYVMTGNVGGLLFDGSGTWPTIGEGEQYPDGTAWIYFYEIFYVRRVDNDVPPRLSRKILQKIGSDMTLVTEDIAEGVENLRLMFGIDSDDNGEVDTYVDANSVANWDQVESVEVYMLVRSATKDMQYTDVKTYQTGAGTLGPYNDNFRRLISHTSVSLRNRKLIIRGGA